MVSVSFDYSPSADTQMVQIDVYAYTDIAGSAGLFYANAFGTVGLQGRTLYASAVFMIC
jgi:hypothetical protein